MWFHIRRHWSLRENMFAILLEIQASLAIAVLVVVYLVFHLISFSQFRMVQELLTSFEMFLFSLQLIFSILHLITLQSFPSFKQI